MSKKYSVYCLNEYAEELMCIPYVGNDPWKAIKAWMKGQKKYKFMTYVIADSKESAIELVSAAVNAPEEFVAMCEENKIPYKSDWMLESCRKAVERKCSGFAGEGDMVFPFDLG